MSKQSSGVLRGRVTQVVLVVSLALNLAVLGLLGGAILRDGPPRHHRPPPDVAGAAPYTLALEPDQRRALWGELRREFRRPPRGGMAETYDRAVALLREDPFDAEAFAALLEEQATAAEARRQTGQRALTNYIAGLPADARRAYADRLEEKLATIAERFRGRRRD